MIANTCIDHVKVPYPIRGLIQEWWCWWECWWEFLIPYGDWYVLARCCWFLFLLSSLSRTGIDTWSSSSKKARNHLFLIPYGDWYRSPFLKIKPHQWIPYPVRGLIQRKHFSHTLFLSVFLIPYGDWYLIRFDWHQPSKSSSSLSRTGIDTFCCCSIFLLLLHNVPYPVRGLIHAFSASSANYFCRCSLSRTGIDTFCFLAASSASFWFLIPYGDWYKHGVRRPTCSSSSLSRTGNLLTSFFNFACNSAALFSKQKNKRACSSYFSILWESSLFLYYNANSMQR